MSTTKKKLVLSTVSVKLNCSSCRKPKLSFFFDPKLKSKTPTSHCSSSTLCTKARRRRRLNDCCDNSTTATTATFSPNNDTSSHSDAETDLKCSRTVRGFGRIGGQSVAVEKDSDDPYLDFRHSMLQMILEKEIYSKNDLKELLNCFLQLNSPRYHGIIVRAFTEIWNGVFSVKSRDL